MSEQRMHPTPPIIFLGLCERAAYVREGNTDIFKWNIAGLKHIILSHLFPITLTGWYIGLTFQSDRLRNDIPISITDSERKEVGKITFSVKATSSESDNSALRENRPMIPVLEYEWTTAFLSLRSTDVVINKPGIYFLNLDYHGQNTVIGQLQFVVIDPPPLTLERVAAIRSDPNALKVVRIELGCKYCPSKCKAYAALEPIEAFETEGYLPYQALPDQFYCNCGKTQIDLTILRRNFHSLLGQQIKDQDSLSTTPLYELGALQGIRADFVSLLVYGPREEILQQFIQENPILLHQFPAVQLFAKPPILTFFKADFAIVTPQKELIFIELEKTNTRLMKKDGGVAAPLQHAFDQIRNWLHIVDDHRLAVFDSLGIDRINVSTVRGVVIAGRDSGYDAKDLRLLKRRDWGQITLLTYDDLLFSLDALIRNMQVL
jgi:hypothetical protein